MTILVKVHWKNTEAVSSLYYNLNRPESRTDCANLLKKAKAGDGIAHWEIFEVKKLSMNEALEKLS